MAVRSRVFVERDVVVVGLPSRQGGLDSLLRQLVRC